MIWVAGGLCAAAAGFLAWGMRRSEPVEDLARSGDEPKPGEEADDEVFPEEAV